MQGVCGCALPMRMLTMRIALDTSKSAASAMRSAAAASLMAACPPVRAEGECAFHCARAMQEFFVWLWGAWQSPTVGRRFRRWTMMPIVPCRCNSTIAWHGRCTPSTSVDSAHASKRAQRQALLRVTIRRLRPRRPTAAPAASSSASRSCSIPSDASMSGETIIASAAPRPATSTSQGPASYSPPPPSSSRALAPARLGRAGAQGRFDRSVVTTAQLGVASPAAARLRRRAAAWTRLLWRPSSSSSPSSPSSPSSSSSSSLSNRASSSCLLSCAGALDLRAGLALAWMGGFAPLAAAPAPASPARAVPPPSLAATMSRRLTALPGRWTCAPLNTVCTRQWGSYTRLDSSFGVRMKYWQP